ncbi:nucleotidyltransferase domain-containing protein [Candidatus Pacearchaeota archaeon]|nr:nucleotidyltransferase domain-containing protein [Candidatus Pacearchaeota archaeon]
MKAILAKVDVSPSEKDLETLEKDTDTIIELIENEIKRQRVSAQVFVGGSFAKGTLTKNKEYDIDVFVRFDWTYEDLSGILGKILRPLAKKENYQLVPIHGSRDYFRIMKNNTVFEIIPVILIKNPRESRNVMDLSYFHVQYVKKKLKINKKLIREIQIAKAFTRAQGMYGAESYIQGFSGYALECLILHYKSFEKMARELAKASEQIILDPEKQYKNKQEIIIHVNDSKLHSPVVLIDPTWKERNVLAALSEETFKRFQEALRKFISKPSISFFERKEIGKDELQKKARQKNAEFAHIVMKTNKQAGDIAGTKMKKFSKFIVKSLGRNFKVIEDLFVYKGGNSADLFVIAKKNKEVIQIGPPVSMEKHVKEFKKEHKKTFVKNGYIHARLEVKSLHNSLRDLENNKTVKEMGISYLGINLT